MYKSIKSILFVVCVVIVFTAQTYRPDEKQNHNDQSRPQAQSRPQVQSRPEPQGRPQVQGRQQVQPRREEPRQAINTRFKIQPLLQPVQREREAPRVYAVPAPAPVVNNRFLNRQHHNNWQPRYNFYGNQYHFYPYVNIASVVELSGGYIVAGPDGQNYFYDQGTFYLQAQGGQYVAVPPPIGIIVNPIAVGARQVIVNNQVFYRYKGIFYVQIAQGYQVIGPVQSDSGS